MFGAYGASARRCRVSCGLAAQIRFSCAIARSCLCFMVTQVRGSAKRAFHARGHVLLHGRCACFALLRIPA
eukprot:11218603-Lingulodinium_polyedra.AAC.1